MAATAARGRSAGSAARPADDRGFSLSEVLVATAISGIVISAAGVALQTNLRSIQGAIGLTSGRDGNATGLTLLRSEVMRASQLLFRQGSSEASDNLDGSAFLAPMTACRALAGSSAWNPVFGMSQGSATVPVIYGLGIGRNGTSYALRRCGPATIGGHGSPVLSTVIEAIAPVPCGDGRSRCPLPGLDASGNATDLPAVLAGLSHSLGDDNSSPLRSARQPAFGFRTDAGRRQLELIDPTTGGDGITTSFTSTDPTGFSLRVPLYLSARVQSNAATTATGTTAATACTNCSVYGLPVAGLTRIHFLVDGSDSMSACTTWGRESDVNPDARPYWDPLTNSWTTTTRLCLRTRMQTLQQQLKQVLQNLPADVELLLVSYSGNQQSGSSGINNRRWPADQSVRVIGSGTNRAEAIAFVDSLDDGDPRTWGASSNAWGPMETAFKDNLAKAVFVFSDDPPDLDYYGRAWGDPRRETESISVYTTLNRSRTQKLAFNSISIGRESSWMRTLSNNAYGTYITL
ncbi:MAG: PilW family protein [Cyanobacteriota bacterium]